MRPPADWFRDAITRVKVTADGCWEYQGVIGTAGYGQIGRQPPRGTPYMVHRLVYEHMVGPIPSGLEIDHLCRNRRCCNPDHLEPVTRRENSIRGESPWGKNARKTHCARGHEFSEDNVYTRPNKRERVCLICRRQDGRKYDAKRRPRKAVAR